MPAIVLFEVLCCKIKNFFLIFVFVFLMYYLYEKYSKPITVWYHIANCASWVPRLALLDLMNKLDVQTCSEWNSFVCRGLTVIRWFSFGLMSVSSGLPR